MSNVAKRAVRSTLAAVGYGLVRVSPPLSCPSDFDAATAELWRKVKSFTMTGPERVFALRQSVQYVEKFGIAGDIVECGVWKGGSMMAVALTLLEQGTARRDLVMFDTFEGMSAPTDIDRCADGSAADMLEKSDKRDSTVWAYSPLDEVRRNLQSTTYDSSRLFFVQGKVEDTLPVRVPDKIAILRLDTDWYESTYHELTHLYPRLSVGGVLIIDDYGYWQGAREAVDRYLSENNLKLLLHRIDGTARVAVKLEA